MTVTVPEGDHRTVGRPTTGRIQRERAFSGICESWDGSGAGAEEHWRWNWGGSRPESGPLAEGSGEPLKF